MLRTTEHQIHIVYKLFLELAQSDGSFRFLSVVVYVLPLPMGRRKHASCALAARRYYIRRRESSLAGNTFGAWTLRMNGGAAAAADRQTHTNIGIISPKGHDLRVRPYNTLHFVFNGWQTA